MNKKENLAILFPGQGSQQVGMLGEFADNAIVRNTFEESSEALGYDVWGMICEGPQEKLNMTEITQPVLLSSSIALWRVWQDSQGSVPAYLAGHSLGEWTALVVAEVVAFSDAVKLVRSRGKYMQEAVAPGEGAMSAIIGLADDVVENICAECSSEGVVAPVNYNSPGQLVIAGAAAAVDKATLACKNAGAKKAMPLAVSAPFHTSLMKPAADKLAAEVENTSFAAPVIPVVHNVHAKTENDPSKIKSLMIEQIYHPVKWVSCIEYLASRGIENLVECGPGKVLSGLNRRIDKSLVSYATQTPDVIAESIESVK